MSGTIRKRGANAWQVRTSLRQRDPETGRWRYIQRRVRVTKRNAQRALDALSVEVARGGHRTTGRRTVTDLLDAWVLHLEALGQSRVHARPLPQRNPRQPTALVRTARTESTDLPRLSR